MLIDKMTEEVVTLAKKGESHFLQIARVLRELYETLTADPAVPNLDAYEACLKKAKIGRRRAIYWIEIDRVYGPMNISAKRLSAIGWTKLSTMAKHVEADHIDDWLKFAENNTVEEMRASLAGKDNPTYTLTFKLDKDQYAVIAGTLLGNGAYLTNSAGLANKEMALLKICKTLHRAWKAGIT